MSDIQTTPWYSQTVPEVFGSERSGLSTQNRQSLQDKTYDYVVVGSGLGGSGVAYRLRQILSCHADETNPASILVVDKGKFFGGLSGISGGLTSAELGIGGAWARAAWGEETWHEFLRRLMVNTRSLLQMSDQFENDLGVPVRMAHGLVTALADEESAAFARDDASEMNNLILHDRKYRMQPGPDQPVSVAQFSLSENLPAAKMIGENRYKIGGIHHAFEGAVHPGMLGVLMRFAAKGELSDKSNPNVHVDFAEGIEITSIDPGTGILRGRTNQGEDTRFTGKKIILAGVSPKIIDGLDLHGKDHALKTEDVRTIIAITKPLPPEYQAHFTTAVHDTTSVYNYFWMHPETGRLMWGTGDYKIYPGMPVSEMMACAQDEMAQTLGKALEIDYIWPGDIPYTKDGMPSIFQHGCVTGWNAPGGKGLIASTTLATIVTDSVLGDEREAALLEKLMHRQAGFDADQQAKITPAYLLPPQYLLELTT